MCFHLPKFAEVSHSLSCFDMPPGHGVASPGRNSTDLTTPPRRQDQSLTFTNHIALAKSIKISYYIQGWGGINLRCEKSFETGEVVHPIAKYV